jgi:hypothetical protein
MLNEIGFSMSTFFNVERLMIYRAFIDKERVFTGLVESTGNVMTCVMDDSD